MATKITKTLYVGLGGTGVKAILRTKQCFLDSYGEIPPMVEFMAIDTDVEARNACVSSVNHGLVKLEENELLVCTAPGAAKIYTTFPQNFQWIPKQNISALGRISANGAGQVRSNGRFIARYNDVAIQDFVRKKVDDINKADANPHPRFKRDIDSNHVVYPTIINVVGSIAGGTGSGMLIDVIALIQQALDNSTHAYYIYPWIVMPDVFKKMCPGVKSTFVNSNSYGALRELDYLFHMSLDNKTPIDFGYTKVYNLGETIQYAYIINSTNEKGLAFSHIDDLTDSIGRSMFLPTNAIRGGVSSPMDNIRNNMDSFKTENKDAWCASTGSAELIYDSQAVGDYIGFSIIRSVCKQLCLSDNRGNIDALSWMDEISIQEHNADQLIDSLMNGNCPYDPTLDRDSTRADIDNFITNASDQSDLDDKFNSILDKLNNELPKKINKLVNNAHGIGNAEEFLSSLLIAIGCCEKEMNEESIEHQNTLSNIQNWDDRLKSVFIKIWGIPRTDEDEKEALVQSIRDVVSAKRNIARKAKAIIIYSKLREMIAIQQLRLTGLKNKLEKVASNMEKSVWEIQSAAKKDSYFQIFLHAEDVSTERMPKSDDSEQFIASGNDIADFFEAQKPEEIFDVMRNWANERTEVQDAFKITIERKMSEMPQAKVVEILEHVRNMAAPLWKVDYQGLTMRPKPKVNFMVIGCCDAENNIISDTPDFNKIFDTVEHEPTFVTTEQRDRILILTMAYSAPIYAVKNSTSYYNEYLANLDNRAGYIDEQWNLKMRSEDFKLTPTIITSGPDPMEFWVKGFVLDLIHFDVQTKQYWLRSSKNGVAIKKFRFDLGHTREVAFQTFKNLDIHKEIKEEIDKRNSSEGSTAMKAKLSVVVSDNYLEEYSRISEEDKANLEDSTHYQQLINLITEEIQFIEEKGLTF